jgi:hypothetical protein
VTFDISNAESFMPIAAGQDFKQVILALLRVMTTNSKSGAAVRVGVVADGPVLRVDLRTDEFVRSSQDQIDRFERAGKNVLEASADDLGLAIAIELVDQLGGVVDVEAPRPSSLRIALSWPFEQAEVDE